ncbi:MAG TPA: DNA polymerase/3'-5' exonuclease PolX [Polyangiaceae bacterium]|jgi:DNA polymerase (family 10)|nr:DNA polymerase/3'-5' exonuclease PolX [Polyangiaceae bacterium]
MQQPGKHEVIEMLRELAQLTMLDEENPQSFRVRAYESAEHAIAAQTIDLQALSLKDLQGIEGIGKSTAEKIRELLDTGRVEKLEALRQKHPESIVALLRIQGLGPKMLGRLRRELGVQSLDDLRRVLSEQRLRGLKGFGEKSEEKLRQSLSRLDSQGALDRTPIAVALPLAESILAELRAVPGVTNAVVAGSLRRFSETIGDIDIIVTAAAAEPVMLKLTQLSAVDRVLAHGENKTSVVTRRGVQIDLRVVGEHQLGAALMYFTGSKGHNIKLRQRALSRGFTLNEYALSELEGGRVVASETEAAIYEALGLAFIPPVLREDAGEIEAAEAGRLPAELPPLLGDFHVHTSVSGDARSPLVDMVRAARARGYRALAITDHAEGTRAGASREALLAQAEEIRALQQELGEQLALLHGVELNIGPAGELDYDAEFRRGFSYCLASVHSHFELDRAAQTDRILKAMHDPCVRMIGHLSARHIGGRPGIDLDLGAVLAAAEATGTALEINGALQRLDVSVEVLRQARQRRIALVLTSDAHQESELARIRYAALNAQRAGIDPSQIVNTWPAPRLLDWLAAKRPLG